MERQLRVLIVQDSDAAAAALARELGCQGLEPSWARVDTPAALGAALDGSRWDVVLADDATREFGPLGALRFVKERAPDLPFVVLSSSADEELAVLSLRAGADDHLPKANLARLGFAIEKEVSEAQSRGAQALLVESLPLGVVLQDAKGVIRSLNRAALKILGLSGEGIVGQRLESVPWGVTAKREDGSPLDPRDYPASTSLRTGARFDEFVLGFSRADGKPRWLSMNSEPLYHPGEPSPHAVVISFVDVTERKLLEERYLQAQKMEALGRLAGGVAHDFNNLLTPILGFSELLLSAMPEGTSMRGDVEEIRKAGERGASLTKQLLAFSRKQSADRVLLELNPLLTDLERMLRRITGANVEMRLALANDLAPVRADPGQIEQIVVNLVVNAKDAMPRGGRLTLETANVELHEEYTKSHVGLAPGSYVLLAVSDTGTGISPETLPRLFEPFFTTKGESGTGLGLSTVYGIVKQSGGHVSVYSEVGQGTAVKVYLPRADRDAMVPGIEVPVASGGAEVVLLVEDDAPIRTLAAKLLRRSGYVVLEASNGEEALALADQQSEPIPILVTDTVMPGISGPRLFEELRVGSPRLKALFMSGFTEGTILQGGALAAGSAFLQKPFSPALLTDKVRHLLDERG